MHETPHGFFHLDHPAPGSPLPAGPVTLRGWAAGNHGRPLVDLRVRLGPVCHPVVYGFPRADLAAFFGLSSPFLPGGFEASLDLAPGTHSATFEGLTIAGEWHALDTLTLTVTGERPAAPALPPPALQPHEFARLLQNALRAPATTPPAPVAATLINALPLPAVIRYPHLPFHGHLHQPTLLERVLFGRLRIEGWLFHETIPIRRVLASIDLQALQPLELAGTKPYVAAMFPQFTHAQHCRLDGLIDVPAQLPNPLCVRIYAELADGTWHLGHVQRVHTWEQEQEKQPFAPFSRLRFARLALALDRAARARGFAVPRTRDLWRGIHGVYQEYRTRAQPRARLGARSTPNASGLTPTAPATPSPASNPLRHVTLVTHNLNREGAPLFLWEFARHLASLGTRLHVISAANGALAADYQRLDATVQLVDVQALFAAATPREQTAALADLARELPLRDTNLVIANTLSTWWAIHLAHRAERPSLFSIHESTTPATFYLGHLPPTALPAVEKAFRLATHVSFLTETTRAYYYPWLGPANHSLNPGWIDLATHDHTLAASSRSTRRAALGVSDETLLVVNVGSVCDRKGQHIFARGVDLLWRQAPALAARCSFLMVGARDTLFDADMTQLLAQLGRPNLHLVPATNTPVDYYGAADLFVCSSYEESFPRVIMEAMASGVPILSTAVHGIRDQLTHGVHGWLIPPGHTQAIAEGLQHVLARPELLSQLAAQARLRVAAEYDSAHLLPRHTALAAQVAHSIGRKRHD